MLVITEETEGGGSFACISPPNFLHIYYMDFKKFIENRLMMKELQLMRAEDNGAPGKVISRLFSIVKELRYIYKKLFWRDNKNESRH